MIRRETEEGWLLISQVDHAHLAARIAAAWGNKQIPKLPVPDMLLPAIREHDEGWRDWEQAPEVDLETGKPYAFHETPMSTSAHIWSESITRSGRGTAMLSEALDHLEETGESLDENGARILETVLSYRPTFTQFDLNCDLPDIDTETIQATLEVLQNARVVRHDYYPLPGDVYSVDLQMDGASPFGELWVSQHFCDLAEGVLESRAGQFEEVMVARRFLEEQKKVQETRQFKALRGFAGDSYSQLLDTGFRYVRIFDWMSLWLCLTEQHEPEEFVISQKKKIRVTLEPEPSELTAIVATEEQGNRLQVFRANPWPFRSDKPVEFSLPGVLIPDEPLEDDASLAIALDQGERVQVYWRFEPPHE
ncbi:DUF3891 family protein [Calycomorphotria hydatis]|uniref:DUF3891 domain-containing protein n=1 Tax=Calycomorphotria hydatis TaxID=2528027 RepID=A0A517T6C8_9PLAN|nr:DUF3891 family protein [Calycomorphotria hydatis]QDT63935.1 hypothetical protein V22_11640 [Calycomorphotria hydatis]